MAIFNCSCKDTCTGLAVVASVIIGIITAFLRLTAVITVPAAFLWVTFGIAVVYLAVALVTAAIGKHTNGECVKSVLPALLIGILGTILLSVILLAITFVATSVVGAILTGGLLLFFSLTVGATACLVRCYA